MPRMLKSILDLVEDTSLANMMDLSGTPDVPQVPMERYVAPRGMPKDTEQFLTPENATRLEQIARQGEKGGREWYNLRAPEAGLCPEDGREGGNSGV